MKLQATTCVLGAFLACLASASAAGVVTSPDKTTTTSLTVKWKYLAPTSWTVDSFDVCYKEVTSDIGVCAAAKKTASGDDSSLAINGLKAGTKYAMKVRATIKNSGDGTIKIQTVGMTKDSTKSADPKVTWFEPLGALHGEAFGATSIDLSWEIFDVKEGRFDPEIIALSYKKLNSGGEATVVTLDPKQSTFTTISDGLAPCTSYKVKLFAHHKDKVRAFTAFLDSTVVKTDCLAPPTLLPTALSSCGDASQSYSKIVGDLAEPVAIAAQEMYNKTIMSASEPNVQADLAALLLPLVEDSIESLKLNEDLQLPPMYPMCETKEEDVDVDKAAEVAATIQSGAATLVTELTDALVKTVACTLDKWISRDHECIKLVGASQGANCQGKKAEVLKEINGDISDAVEDLYLPFDTNGCKASCESADVDLVGAILNGERDANGDLVASSEGLSAASLGFVEINLSSGVQIDINWERSDTTNGPLSPRSSSYSRHALSKKGFRMRGRSEHIRAALKEIDFIITESSGFDGFYASSTKKGSSVAVDEKGRPIAQSLASENGPPKKGGAKAKGKGATAKGKGGPAKGNGGTAKGKGGPAKGKLQPLAKGQPAKKGSRPPGQTAKGQTSPAKGAPPKAQSLQRPPPKGQFTPSSAPLPADEQKGDRDLLGASYYGYPTPYYSYPTPYYYPIYYPPPYYYPSPVCYTYEDYGWSMNTALTLKHRDGWEVRIDCWEKCCERYWNCDSYGCTLECGQYTITIPIYYYTDWCCEMNGRQNDYYWPYDCYDRFLCSASWYYDYYPYYNTGGDDYFVEYPYY